MPSPPQCAEVADVTARTIKHVSIHGRVQGVGYRAFVEREALRAGIGGWVRNRRDGSVEALFAGEPDKVETVIALCRKGPFSARVETLQEREGTEADLAPRRPGELFSVLPTV
jgi:acylphosphatase